LFDFLKKTPEPEGRKASAVGRVVYAGSGRVAWTPRNTGALARAGFDGNPVGYRCVRLIAEAAAALPLVLQDAAQRYAAHPILALLARPNTEQTQAELLEALFVQLMLSGNGFVEGVYGDDGAVQGLYVLRSDRVSVVPGADGWPVAYEYKLNGKAKRLTRAAVCHVRLYNPGDDHYGMSPLQSAARAVDVHNAASHWSKALLDNAARPSGAIVYQGSEGQGVLSAEQYERLLGEIEAHHMGARNAGRPMLLEGGLDWKPMGFSPSDMEFQKTREAAARDIAMAFGVPPMLLGLPGDATYANYQEAQRAFYRQTVLPLASRVAARLAQFLGGALGEAVILKPDLDQVTALAGERDSQWARIAGADFLSDSEKRRMLGLPELANG
jgi:HK97 family phage portal protein